jgi:predicted GNAT family acetyltransferase
MELTIVQENDEERGMFCAMNDKTVEGLLSYIWADKDHILIYYTKAIREMDEDGIKKQLINAVVEYARKNNKKIVPISSYAKLFLTSDRKYSDICEAC